MFASEENRPTRRFDGLARLYARCRPGYSDGAVTYIIGSPGGPVRLADVGCGTGISSRLFARHGAEVVGVEPNAEMRAEAEATPFEGPGAPPAYRDGRAEATGLPDAWADVVAAAQAFHWFYPEAALREFRRVLKPGGTVALLWNEPDTADPTTAAYCAALVESTPGTEYLRTPEHLAGGVLLTHPLFTGGEARTFPNGQELTEGELIDRAFSVSWAPRTPPASDELARRLRDVFGAFARGGRVRLAYRTVVYRARAAAG